MANEAVIVNFLGDGGDVVEYTCADGVAISQGALLHLKEPRTVVASAAKGEAFAGIARADKEANDGATTIGVLTNVIADLTLNSGAPAISAGKLLVLSGSNLLTIADTDNSEDQGLIVGKALEDSTANSSEVIEVKVSA